MAVFPDQVGAFARLSAGFSSGCDPLPNQYSGRYIRLEKLLGVDDADVGAAGEREDVVRRGRGRQRIHRRAALDLGAGRRARGGTAATAAATGSDERQRDNAAAYRQGHPAAEPRGSAASLLLWGWPHGRGSFLHGEPPGASMRRRAPTRKGVPLIMVHRGLDTAHGSLQGAGGTPGHTGTQHCPRQHCVLHLAVLLTTTITM